MSDNQVIPEAAIEAAAKVIREKSLHSNYYPTHDAIVSILEAAAPHIRAQALEDAADAWQVRMDTIGRGTVEAKTFMQRRAQADRAAK